MTGATGRLGSRVLHHLSRQGQDEEVVALTRSVLQLPQSGAGWRHADYDDAAGLKKSLCGVGALLLVASNAPDPGRLTQHQRVIEESARAGVDRIVYTSLTGCDTRDTEVDHTHRETERLIRESGMRWTMLRNAEYTENWTATIPDCLRAGAVSSNTGYGRLSTATRDDLAEAAAIVLTTAGHDGKVYDLCGENLWTFADFAAEIAELTGQPVVYRELDDGEQRAQFTGRGTPGHVVELMLDVHAHIRAGGFDHTSPDLRLLLGRLPESLRDTVARTITS